MGSKQYVHLVVAYRYVTYEQLFEVHMSGEWGCSMYVPDKIFCA